MPNKTAVVSGGTKGIGKAIVAKFMENGFDVITCSRNQNDLDALKDETVAATYQGKLFTFKSDLSKKDEVIDFAKYIQTKSDHVDVLVNNAGVFLPGEMSTEKEGSLEFMINTNLYSAYHLTRSLIQGMIASKSGDIFNICSVASKMAYPNGGSYSISKFAMYGMSKGLREELKPHGIRVTAVLPGATYTASWDGVDLPEDRFIKPEDVAEAVWSAYSLSRNSVVEDLIIRPQLGDI
ncbi:SDR family oxidoreductase [Reichenbachiella sp. MALMAid0571]|uniref:SDR family oxidoreductase n=1 Tax=Reichenbachiella sp. MALMAid0571 TaxID=3143939 RepID=UPI0032DFCCA3